MAPASASNADEGEATDAELVSLMARGDSQALGALYDRYAPSLLALIERIAGRGSEAEDLVHDVFLEAWRRAADYDASRGSVKAWLLLRARSRALDHRKSARVARRSGGGDGAWLDELADLGAEPSLAVDQARLRDTLVKLPNDQRAVLLLGYFEGLSSSEIAERLEIPLGTVKSRVAAALASLRQAISSERVKP